jgi:hypothetical protein
MTGRSWASPAAAASQGAGVEAARVVAVPYSPVSWWLVNWRGRVLEESTGNVDRRLRVVLDTMEQLGPVGGRPAVRPGGAGQVVLEFWFEASGTREATGGARVALRQGFRAAGVGDPTPATGAGPADVMVMLEELPSLLRDEP